MCGRLERAEVELEEARAQLVQSEADRAAAIEARDAAKEKAVKQAGRGAGGGPGAQMVCSALSSRN